MGEFGTEEEICVFDGDVTIGGRPYRSHELDANHTLFGGYLDLTLFEADWEVRVAYEGYAWSNDHADGSPRAFPAVRGQICYESGINQVTGGLTYENCTTWAPCEGVSATCRCEFQAETYMCFEEDQFNTWRPIYHRYSKSNALANLGQWWSVNYTNA